MSGFERAGARLLCDGVSLEEAARRHGTPLYVYSRKAIVDAYRAYDEAFASVPHRICYAVKANGTGGLLRLFASLGAGADIVSGFELKAARRAGFPPDRIVFSGVGKTDEEIALGVAEGIGEFNAESEDEIARIDAAAQAAGRRVALTLRVNPDIDAQSHPYISTGLRENKFGVDIALAPGILERTRARAGVEIVGVQSHIGSQIRSLEPLTEAVAALAGLSQRLRAAGFPLRVIDLGGGLGVNYEEGSGPDVSAFAAAVLPVVKPLGLTVLLEPGRSLVARAGVLLARVLYVKENHGKRFVIVDAGMNDLMRPALYKAHHRVEPVVEKGGAKTRVDVVGPVCESGDFFARDRMLEEVRPGDLVAIRDAGAYAFSMASNYNMRARPAEVLVQDGNAVLIRRRETFEDLVGTEVG
jgi:diaminopimelate decarboxylase